jgi:hypothetical protein
MLTRGTPRAAQRRADRHRHAAADQADEAAFSILAKCQQ